MSHCEKTWAKGWRIVLTCIGCEKVIWAKNVGETVRCECDTPNFITDNPTYYTCGERTNNYKLELKKVADAY